jgi:hypothetical protein
MSEMIVGFLDRERGSGQLGTAEELNDYLAKNAEEHHLSPPPRFSDEDLNRVRKKRGELFKLWDEVPTGESLELRFDIEHMPASRQ